AGRFERADGTTLEAGHEAEGIVDINLRHLAATSRPLFVEGLIHAADRVKLKAGERTSQVDQVSIEVTVGTAAGGHPAGAPTRRRLGIAEPILQIDRAHLQDVADVTA